MTRPADGERYLKNHKGRYYYYRRVPRKFQALDARGTIRKALNTASLETAKMRRDELALADDEYWAQLALADAAERAGRPVSLETATHRYNLAQARAMAAGFKYRPLDQLADPKSLEEIVRRALSLEHGASSSGDLNPADIEAVFGGVKEPKATISEALGIWKKEIAPPLMMSKSPNQKKIALQTKERSVNYFVEAVGDLPMSEIVRDHGREYFAWWTERILGEGDDKKYSPKTANRHIGDIRKLYNDYFAHIGDEDRVNPFRSLRFKTKKKPEQPAFETSWVRDRILAPGALDGISKDIVCATFMMIETGARPSEIINLRPEDIVLDGPAPHISIAERDDRENKTETSIRKIPLVGVSLEAARRTPDGFPHYHDKGGAFSAASNAAYRRRGLFPTDGHVIYSFRHSFEKRMQEANLDYGLRCLLMGHKTDRPIYGDGGSLEYRRDELLKIAHPIPKDIFASFDA